MGQKAGKKWTAAAVLQPTFLLPPTLLVMVPALLWRFQAMGARGAGHKPGQGAVTSLTVICFTSATAARKHSRISNFEKPLSTQKAALVATLALGVVSRLRDVPTSALSRIRRPIVRLVFPFEILVLRATEHA